MANIQQKIVYPHRTPLLDTQNCDVCDSTGNHFLRVRDRSYVGLWICSSFSCKEQAHSWLAKSTISLDVLSKEFGEWVYVQRSNGRKESGWIICGDAYQDEANGPFWVTVKDKHHRSKCVTLERLRSWNQ